MAFDEAGNKRRVKALRERGVEVWGPERVYIAEEVDLERIAPGAELRQATLSGETLSIGKGAVIGASGHAEVRDCQIGPECELGSGLYAGATLLEGVKVRGFAEIRPGTLLEEQVELAHCVALKNTTMTACCVAGSLINFCDVFVTGGTSREDHTEIGSGAVHYNFDPRGDKWGSLLGDIRGVLMRSDPVFIGGSCGLVGPVEIGLGAVTAAGSTVRQDVEANTLVSTAGKEVNARGQDRAVYGSLGRKFRVTARLVATLQALRDWYEAVRIPHASGSERALFEAARERIEKQVGERVYRLDRIVGMLITGEAKSLKRHQAEHTEILEGWEELQDILGLPITGGGLSPAFLKGYAKARETGSDHLMALKEVDYAVALEMGKSIEEMVSFRMGEVDGVLPEQPKLPSGTADLAAGGEVM